MRPSELSDDFCGREVVAHAIDVLDDKYVFEDVCCIYATAPFVSPDDLIGARSVLSFSRPGTVVFSATTFPHPIQRSFELDDEGYSRPIYPEAMSMRSQDLVETYHDAGQFYWASIPAWQRCGSLLEAARPFILPRWRVQDIDTKKTGNEPN